jgi:hypothetical protein
MTTPAPAPVPAPAASVPGKTLGIVGLIAAIVWPFQLLGLILSLVARSQSKAAGVKNTPAKAGIIVSIILLVLTIVGIILSIVLGAAAVGGAYAELCEGMDPGVYELTDGSTVTCG